MDADPSAAPRTVFVGGLDENVNETALQALFVPFGEISAVQMPIEYTTQKHKGFGFVIFAEEEDAEAAIDNLNNAEFYGKVIRVNIAKKAKFQPGGGKAVWADADAWNSDKAQDSGSKESRAAGTADAEKRLSATLEREFKE